MKFFTENIRVIPHKDEREARNLFLKEYQKEMTIALIVLICSIVVAILALFVPGLNLTLGVLLFFAGAFGFFFSIKSLFGDNGLLEFRSKFKRSDIEISRFGGYLNTIKFNNLINSLKLSDKNICQLDLLDNKVIYRDSEDNISIIEFDKSLCSLFSINESSAIKEGCVIDCNDMSITIPSDFYSDEEMDTIRSAISNLFRW